MTLNAGVIFFRIEGGRRDRSLRQKSEHQNHTDETFRQKRYSAHRDVAGGVGFGGGSFVPGIAQRTAHDLLQPASGFQMYQHPRRTVGGFFCIGKSIGTSKTCGARMYERVGNPQFCACRIGGVLPKGTPDDTHCRPARGMDRPGRRSDDKSNLPLSEFYPG